MKATELIKKIATLIDDAECQSVRINTADGEFVEILSVYKSPDGKVIEIDAQ